MLDRSLLACGCSIVWVAGIGIASSTIRPGSRRLYVLQVSHQVTSAVGTRPVLVAKHFVFGTEYLSAQRARCGGRVVDVLYVRAQLTEMLVAVLAETRVVLLVPLTAARYRRAPTRTRLHLCCH